MRAFHALVLPCFLLACGARPGARPAAVGVASPDDACFGGTPEVVVANVDVAAIDVDSPHNTDLFVAGGHLIWPDFDGPTLFNLTTRVSQHVELGIRAHFKTADERELYAISFPNHETSHSDLVAVDLKTHKRRIALAGRDDSVAVLGGTRVAVEGEYLYFIEPKLPRIPVDSHGVFRARRDGTGAPERIGAEPRGRNTSFLVAGGYLYWSSDENEGSPALWRRGLTPDAPVQRLASIKSHDVPLTLAHGRLFFVDTTGIASVPVDGSTPPTLHAASTMPGRTSVVADRACVYWTSERGIYRTRLAGAATPELIAEGSHHRGGGIVTDGQRLYWMDRRNRILALGRAPGALPEPPVLLAKSVDRKILQPDSATRESTLLVGDGWGCAKVFGWNQPHWQCWQSGAQPGTPVKARAVWLSPEARPAVGPDRLCVLDGSKGRCWTWAELVQAEPADLPKSQVPQGKLGQWLVGGTFSCLLQYVGAERMLVCTGENAYGQLAQEEQPVALERWKATLGTWHGCAASSNSTNDLMCWGRGDAGQLGRVPTETCTVKGNAIPCERSLRKVDFTLPGVEGLQAGDMFTCAIFGYPREVRCWGGSRDGWLGDTPCSPELRQAWPVETGFVSAPKATCSNVAVRILEPGSTIQEVSIGPRGVCLIEDGRPRCLGAIATPSAPVNRLAVSKGSQAQACGIDDKRVLCWGEGYSPAGQPGVPVAISFESTVPASAVIDFAPPAGTPWSADHLVNHACDRFPVTLPACDAQATGEPWTSLLPKVDSLKDQKVSVRDRLVVGPLDPSSFSEMSCSGSSRNSRAREGERALPGTNHLGCYRDHRRVVLGDSASPLRLWSRGGEFECVGDESRLCCGAPAFGQTVVATGVLFGSAERGWGLRDVTLCEVRPR